MVVEVVEVVVAGTTEAPAALVVAVLVSAAKPLEQAQSAVARSIEEKRVVPALDVAQLAVALHSE